jgi:tRNA-specific adenosine deaminase 3
MTHLRRVSAAGYLPEHVLEKLAAAKRGGRKAPEKKPSNDKIPKSQKTLYLLLCPTSYTDHDTVSRVLAEAFAANKPPVPAPLVNTITAPLFAPTTPEQAEHWTATLWPTIYKNSNPYGPHPADLARAEAELHADSDSADGTSNVAHWMRAALRVAVAGRRHGLGEEIGAVVVERTPEHGARVVAAAADARWCGIRDEAAASSARGGAGACNVMGHAVMRVIGMVGQKRRIVDRKFAEAAAKAAANGVLTTGPEPDNTDDSDYMPVAGPDSPRTDVRSGSPAPIAEPLRPVVKLPPRPPPPRESIPVPYVDATSATPFLDLPLTPLERSCFANPALSARGYLCLHLELYTTHEPCVMCSMALLHSRFGRVVFWRAMPRTGALFAERQMTDADGAAEQESGADGTRRKRGPRKRGGRGGKLVKTPEQQARHAEEVKAKKLADQLAKQQPWTAGAAASSGSGYGYGLFWRPQLNWKFPCWQWRPDPAEALRIMTGGLARLRVEDGAVGENAVDEAEEAVGLDGSWAEPVFLDEKTHA